MKITIDPIILATPQKALIQRRQQTCRQAAMGRKAGIVVPASPLTGYNEFFTC
jgi:hypothetical protein